jgi:preprotein translocase subunit SecE
VAQTKSSQPGAGGGSNPARVGANREQSRRGVAVGAGGGRAERRAATTGGATSAPLPVARRGRPGNPLNFIRDVRSELRKVAWPTSRETANLTIVVIALSIAVGIVLGGFDYAFQELFKWLLEATTGAAAL